MRADIASRVDALRGALLDECAETHGEIRDSHRMLIAVACSTFELLARIDAWALSHRGPVLTRSGRLLKIAHERALLLETLLDVMDRLHVRRETQRGSLLLAIQAEYAERSGLPDTSHRDTSTQ
uniref:Uncharacterized protein n=1 Tax=uncultured prokaryote TaxID=198431 RepID=H5SEF6_9ZZZZ|nr:hypothetical protein HGMM_F16F12C08 [uncultured prokaryote]